MKTNPVRRVYLLGVVVCVSLLICSRHFEDRGGPYFMASLTLAGIAYLFATREFFACPALPRRLVIFGLVLAAVWHGAFLRLPVGPDDDIHRYVWDGRLQRLGYNPYLVIPSDPSSKALHTDETRNLNNPDLPSPYPPGAELFFRAVTSIHESVFALRLAFFICELGIVILLLDLLRKMGRGAHLVLAFAWNPLLAIEVAGSGHIDILGALLLVMSVAALLRGWRGIAALGFSGAVAVKFLPIVVMPFYWKRIRIRDAVLGAALFALLYVPFLDHGRIPLGSLGAYVQGFRFNGPVFAALDGLASPRWLTGLAVLIGLVTAVTIRRFVPQNSPEVFAWPMAASLFCAPVVFPWYLLWLLPFLTSPSTLLILIWTVSIIPTYVMWHFRTIGLSWGALPGWVMILEYGCVALTGVILLLHRISRPRVPHSSCD